MRVRCELLLAAMMVLVKEPVEVCLRRGVIDHVEPFWLPFALGDAVRHPVRTD